MYLQENPTMDNMRLPNIWGKALLLNSFMAPLCATATNRARDISKAGFFQGRNGFELQGCFHYPPSEGAGDLLGPDFIMPTNASMSDSMTVSLCLDACTSAKGDNGSSFEFVALGGGRCV